MTAQNRENEGGSTNGKHVGPGRRGRSGDHHGASGPDERPSRTTRSSGAGSLDAGEGRSADTPVATARPTAPNREQENAAGQDRLLQSGDGSEGRRSRCRCGVWESVHREGGGCGNFRKASRIRLWLQDHSTWAHIAAPIWLRIPEKHRWTVVNWLNKSPRRCWSDLVSDALAYRESDACDVHVPRIRAERAPQCALRCDWLHPDHAGEHDCNCYCGKFRFTATEGSRDRQGTAL